MKLENFAKCMAIAALLVCHPIAWADEESSVRLTQSDGAVEIVKAGAAAGSPAREGAVLERGDRLVTRDKSAALLLWSNGSMVKLYPNTEIVLAGVSFDLEKKMEMTLLDLEKGRLFVKAQVPEHLFSNSRCAWAGRSCAPRGPSLPLPMTRRRKASRRCP